MKIETLSVDFTDEQKRYLEGFTTGLQISRVGRGLGGASAGKANAEPSGPDAAHIKAQDKVIASGKKLADQEKFKREEHPFDAYPRLKEQALQQRAAVAGGQFSLALLRPVLRRAGAGFLHVPPADSERHPQALAVRRAWPISPSACAGRSATSPPAPICRSAKFRRSTRWR